MKSFLKLSASALLLGLTTGVGFAAYTPKVDITIGSQSNYAAGATCYACLRSPSSNSSCNLGFYQFSVPSLSTSVYVHKEFAASNPITLNGVTDYAINVACGPAANLPLGSQTQGCSCQVSGSNPGCNPGGWAVSTRGYLSDFLVAYDPTQPGTCVIKTPAS